jgi:hypothetical protein
MSAGDQATIDFIAVAISKARNGIVYDTKDGAFCPACGERVKVLVTKPWLGSSRLRYHKCDNPKCVMCVLDETIRSWQEI